MISTRSQIRVIRVREFVRIENNRRPESHEWTNTQSIMKSSRVGVRKSNRLIIIATDNVRVEVSVAIATLSGAASVRRAFQTIVNNAAPQVGRTKLIKAEMSRRSGG